MDTRRQFEVKLLPPNTVNDYLMNYSRITFESYNVDHILLLLIDTFNYGIFQSLWNNKFCLVTFKVEEYDIEIQKCCKPSLLFTRLSTCNGRF